MHVTLLRNEVYCFQSAVMVGALRHINIFPYRGVAGPSRSALAHRPQQRQRASSNPGIIEKKQTNKGPTAFFASGERGEPPEILVSRVNRQVRIQSTNSKTSIFVGCVDYGTTH